ncbi:PDZ domain-containing protein, partial [candidate division KSB1 bacterium]|nr:PDZ domain-containing protein [candidate division KSB1 bacterium]
VIMQDLIHKGRVVRGYLGIAMQDIDEKKARALGLKKPVGVFIDSVSDDGPAMKAGLKEKDVLIKIGDQVVNNANIVQSIIAEKSPGDELVLTFIRKNKDRKITVTLGERQQIIIVPPVIKKNRTYKNLGLDIESIKSRFASDLGIYSEYGVLVISVERFSPSFEAGIHINDVILEIGDRKILSIEMFYKAIASLKKGDVTIIKVRRGDTLFHAFVEM